VADSAGGEGRVVLKENEEVEMSAKEHEEEESDAVEEVMSHNGFMERWAVVQKYGPKSEGTKKGRDIKTTAPWAMQDQVALSCMNAPSSNVCHREVENEIGKGEVDQ